jgi:hypothetical protein
MSPDQIEFQCDRGAYVAVRSGEQRHFSIQAEFQPAFPRERSRACSLDKHAGIGQKEQLFTGFQVSNQNRKLELRARFG